MILEDLKKLQIIENRILIILDKYESIYEAVSNEELKYLCEERKKIINKETKNMFKIYTDGSCRLDMNKHKIGQFANLLVDDKSNYVEPYISSIFYNVTNSDMEIQGLSFAIGTATELIPFAHTIEIYTDSNYAYRGYNEWLDNWAKNHWLTSKKEPVAQLQYWQTIYQYKINDTKNKISVKWVKGHNNNPYNNLVDAMCNGTIPKGDTNNIDYFKKIWYNKYIK